MPTITTRQRRLVFFLYIALALLSMAILFIYNGVDSPWPWMCAPFLVFSPVFYMKFVHLPYIVWKDSYSVGVAAIDYDHKRLLELVNRVVSAYSFDMGDDFSQEIFNKLIDYTKYHFAREEQLMEKYDYPGWEDHKLQHGKFIVKINDFYNQLENNGVTFYEVFDFLRDWWINHIGKSDDDLGAYILSVQQNPAYFPQIPDYIPDIKDTVSQAVSS